jgi:hypothetical protein
MAISTFVNLTSTGTVLGGEGVLRSMYVNSTSSGAFRLWHGTSYANIGNPIGGTITPVIGFHNLGNIHSTAGVYLQGNAGSFNITFHIQEVS